MSIPLDKLYNFLHGHCDHDALIYHFYPYGSKNPQDLKMLKTEADSKDPYILPITLFHDQELLQFDLWPQHPATFLIDNVPHSRIKKYSINYNLYDKVLLIHSEKNSSELKKFEDDGAIGIYYWSHALIALDWFRYAEHDPLLSNPGHKNKNFLIYNRAWTSTREYRLKFIELIIRNNLAQDCLTSFNPTDNGVYYKDHQFKNLSLSISEFDMENIFPLNTHPSHASADYQAEDYNQTNVEIVLETIFDDDRLHLTEKTLRPIAVGHPFLLCATPGSLRYLKDYGFKTFDNFWDESYDTITDPLQRLECIVDLMKHIQTGNIDWDKVTETAQFNRMRFFGNEFYDQVVNEFKQNFNAGFKELQNYKSGKYFLRNYNFFKDKPVSKLPEEFHTVYEYFNTEFKSNFSQ